MKTDNKTSPAATQSAAPIYYGDSYKLRTDGGKLAQALCKVCAEGEPGEVLIRSGCGKEAFDLFVARLCFASIAKKRTVEQLATLLGMVSAENASAARQKIEESIFVAWTAVDANGDDILTSPDADGKGGGEPTFHAEQSVASYWLEGGAKAPADLSLLDL